MPVLPDGIATVYDQGAESQRPKDSVSENRERYCLWHVFHYVLDQECCPLVLLLYDCGSQLSCHQDIISDTQELKEERFTLARGSRGFSPQRAASKAEPAGEGAW